MIVIEFVFLVDKAALSAKGTAASESSPQALSASSPSSKDQQIRVTVHPSIEKYEEKLLDRISKIQFDNFPGSLTPDSNNNLPHPIITERRLHIGFHNGRTFIGQPTIITLKPRKQANFDEEDLVFKGVVELDNYVEQQHREPNHNISDGIVLAFVMEYKTLLTVNFVPDKKRTGFAAILDKLAPTPAEPTQMTRVREKFVVVGYGAWPLSAAFESDPAQDGADLDAAQTLYLDTLRGNNPLGALVYSPRFVDYHSEHGAGSVPGSHPLRAASFEECNIKPLALSFVFNPPESQKQPPSPCASPAPIVPQTDVHPAPVVIKQIEPIQVAETAPTIEAQPQPQVHKPQTPSPPPASPKPVTPEPVIADPTPDTGIDPSQSNSDSGGDEEIQAVQNRTTIVNQEFTPFPLPQPSSLRPQLSRTERARLLTAGFELLLDDEAHKPVEIQVANQDQQQLKIDMNTETADLRSNQISILFQGLTFSSNVFHKLGDENGPGFTANYTVEARGDPPSTSPRYGPHAFQNYLAHNCLFIDLWDGDTLLHLGSGCVRLRASMRQGRPGVYFEDDVDIISNDHGDDMPATQVHLGHAPNLAKLSLKESAVVYDFHHNAKYRPMTFHESKRLPEIDPELSRVLSDMHADRAFHRSLGSKSQGASETATKDVQSNTREHKLLQHAADILKKLDMAPSDLMAKCTVLTYCAKIPERFMFKLSRDERERDLNTIDIFRERHRKHKTHEMLREQITTQHTISPSLGQATFFEFVFTNPYNSDHIFNISWQDDELRLVTDVNEWRYHRRLHGLRNVSENESTLIRSGGLLDKNVTFLNSKDQPAAILAISVRPKPYFVDRVMRLFRSEDEVIRKVIRFPVGNIAGNRDKLPSDINPVFDPASPSQISESSMREITFKYRVGQAPDTRAVYILFFHDPFHTSLHGIWRIFVHSLFRFDMNCVLGQTNVASFVLRGSSMSRPVMCFSSLPLEIAVGATSPFMLTANALNEVVLLARPEDMRSKEAVLNVVDISSGFLVSSWLVVTHCNLPDVTKTFELNLARGKLANKVEAAIAMQFTQSVSANHRLTLCSQTKINKRVSYTNPFMSRKVLYLRTDSPHLLQFKEPVLDLAPGTSDYIGMRFLPQPNQLPNSQENILQAPKVQNSKTEQHTILLLQAATSSRVWADFASVDLAMEELITHFELTLRERFPNKATINYEIADFNKYIDSTPDMGCLVFNNETKSYLPRDKKWIKDRVFEKLSRSAVKQ
eukprot:jgi/Hompol1/5255/HPOL_001930-RA